MELFKNAWVEIVLGFGFSMQYCPYWYFDERPMLILELLYIKFFIHLPFRSGIADKCEWPTYGFYFMNNDFVVTRGDKRKYFHLPWQYDWIRTSYFLKDSTWAHDKKGNRKPLWEKQWKDKQWQEVYDYTYICKNGAVQNRKATVKIEEMEWRMRFLRWTNLFAKVRRYIDFRFDDEVGEEVNTWKGGVIGSSYEMRKGETPEQTLRRMEKERKF